MTEIWDAHELFSEPFSVLSNAFLHTLFSIKKRREGKQLDSDDFYHEEFGEIFLKLFNHVASLHAVLNCQVSQQRDKKENMKGC